jgi:hypothetical protein
VASYVRKSLITISAKFVPPGGGGSWVNGVYVPASSPPTQPTSSVAVLEFPSASGAQVSTTIPMSLGSDGVTWSCQWDSSACAGGVVDWVVFGSGTVQGANQGSFTIVANQANTF